MKLFILICATIVLTSSIPLSGKDVKVFKDGTIIIRCDDGKQLMISKQMGSDGGIILQIELIDPHSSNRKIYIDDKNHIMVIPQMMHTDNYRISSRVEDVSEMERYKRSKSSSSSQLENLAAIVREYEGVVDEHTFEELLNKVQKLVGKGKVSSTILTQLQMLAQQPWSIGINEMMMRPQTLEESTSFDPTMHMKRANINMWSQPIRTGTFGRSTMQTGLPYDQKRMFTVETSSPLVWPRWQIRSDMMNQDLMRPNMMFANQRTPIMSYDQMMRMQGLTPPELMKMNYIMNKNMIPMPYFSDPSTLRMMISRDEPMKTDLQGPWMIENGDKEDMPEELNIEPQMYHMF